MSHENGKSLQSSYVWLSECYLLSQKGYTLTSSTDTLFQKSYNTVCLCSKSVIIERDTFCSFQKSYSCLPNRLQLLLQNGYSCAWGSRATFNSGAITAHRAVNRRGQKTGEHQILGAKNPFLALNQARSNSVTLAPKRVIALSQFG